MFNIFCSDTDTDDETYEEALEEPITKEGTLRWAERYKKRYSHKDDDSDSDGYSSSDHFSYYENSSGGMYFKFVYDSHKYIYMNSFGYFLARGFILNYHSCCLNILKFRPTNKLFIIGIV